MKVAVIVVSVGKMLTVFRMQQVCTVGGGFVPTFVEGKNLVGKLNEEAAKRYILTSLRKEYASENGTDLNEILPKMSPLNPQYHTKKQSVFEKISTFVEKFKGVGGVI